MTKTWVPCYAFWSAQSITIITFSWDGLLGMQTMVRLWAIFMFYGKVGTCKQ